MCASSLSELNSLELFVTACCLTFTTVSNHHQYSATLCRVWLCAVCSNFRTLALCVGAHFVVCLVLRCALVKCEVHKQCAQTHMQCLHWQVRVYLFTGMILLDRGIPDCWQVFRSLNGTSKKVIERKNTTIQHNANKDKSSDVLSELHPRLKTAYTFRYSGFELSWRTGSKRTRPSPSATD